VRRNLHPGVMHPNGLDCANAMRLCCEERGGQNNGPQQDHDVIFVMHLDYVASFDPNSPCNAAPRENPDRVASCGQAS
jgi:hypothetical protein